MIEISKNPISDDEGMIINFAVRYAIGRKTYAPSAVIQYVMPRLPLLNDRTLIVMYNDMLNKLQVGSIGDPQIDAPKCRMFFESIKAEINNRGLIAHQTTYGEYDYRVKESYDEVKRLLVNEDKGVKSNG